ncbi:MAG: hypothetical protein LBF50_01665 [Azoarcus sp.]|jgi:hypothetical protein|nr:hypothetical protein [Azoarcus sp.]
MNPRHFRFSPLGEENLKEEEGKRLLTLPAVKKSAALRAGWNEALSRP